MSRSNQLAGLITATPTSTLDTINEINTSLNNDANLSTTLTNSINAKAPTASPTFTGTVSGVTKTHVGLGNVTNDAQVPASGGTFSGNVAVAQGSSNNSNLKVETTGTGHAELFLKTPNRQYNIGLLNDGSKFQLYDVNAGANRFEVDTSGNFGIGRTPSAPLDVEGEAYVRGNLTMVGNDKSISAGDSTNGYMKVMGGGTNNGGAIEFRGGGNSGDLRFFTGTSGAGTERMRITSAGRIKHNGYYLPKENEVTSTGTSHNPIPFANLWGTDTTLIITMVAIAWSATNGQDAGGMGFTILALDRHFGSYGTHQVVTNSASHGGSYLPSWSCGSTGLTCTTKSGNYRWSYTILGNTSVS